MSLFKTREWWSTACGNGEEFDQGCMAIGNVDESRDGGSKIVTGSFSGMIRVYAPKERDYKVDDLVLEVDLKIPIIQVEVGRFVSHTEKSAIAVLHPRKLVVYTLDTKGAANAYHQLHLEYEHRLEHTGTNEARMYSLSLSLSLPPLPLSRVCAGASFKRSERKKENNFHSTLF